MTHDAEIWLSASTFTMRLAARIANEFLYAPTRLSFDTVPTVTGPGD